MRICQVVTGLIPVPNDRWGATEKVIWNYKKSLDSLGEVCDVKYLNEVNTGDYDIVHIHMANLCLEAKKRGIPYIFSMHDHHVEHYGKGSFIYNQNLEAIKGSLFSITHAEHYIDLFPDTDKLFYLRHGVDTSFFKPCFRDYTEIPKLLMVANNGLAGDYSIDRKGFEVGIRAAKELNLPITIIGAEANSKFFEAKSELLAMHIGLTTDWSNPTDDVILHHYNTHDIFLHPSSLEAGHPNLTLLEAMATHMAIVATYKGSMQLPNLIRVERPKVDDFVNGIEEAIRLSKFTNDRNRSINESLSILQMYKEFDWIGVCAILKRMYGFIIENKEFHDTNYTKAKYIDIYNNLIA
jgi:glycosyltransferase involved in cell wall biosynthesis